MSSESRCAWWKPQVGSQLDILKRFGGVDALRQTKQSTREINLQKNEIVPGKVTDTLNQPMALLTRTSWKRHCQHVFYSIANMWQYNYYNKFNVPGKHRTRRASVMRGSSDLLCLGTGELIVVLNALLTWHTLVFSGINIINYTNLKLLGSKLCYEHVLIRHCVWFLLFMGACRVFNYYCPWIATKPLW